VAGGHSLERIGDKGAGAPAGIRARLLLHLPDVPCELVPDEILRAFQELLLRLVHGQPGDPLEGGDLVVLRLPQLFLQRLDVHLPVAEALLTANELGELLVDLLLLLENTLLDLHDLDAPILDLSLDLGAELDDLLTRLHLCLTANRVGLALGVADDPSALRFGRSHA
jgi:hypothetical protein